MSTETKRWEIAANMNAYPGIIDAVTGKELSFFAGEDLQTLCDLLNALEAVAEGFERIVDGSYQIDEEYGAILIDDTFYEMGSALAALASLEELREGKTA